MKRFLTLLLCAAVVAAVWGVTAQQSAQKGKTQTEAQRAAARQQKHEERVQRRAERLAAYEKHMDSVILSRNFEFSPQTMQRQPAGMMRQLHNPNFTLGVWDTTVDLCLPYLKGYVPPYYYTVFNYVLPMVSGYRAEQTHEGWIVSFSSTLFSANDYTFTLEIYSSTGGATLTLSSVWYGDVQYTGIVTPVY